MSTIREFNRSLQVGELFLLLVNMQRASDDISKALLVLFLSFVFIYTGHKACV